MEESVILVSSFVVLVGLCLIFPNRSFDTIELDLIESKWNQSPLLLKIVYPLCCISGFVFVLVSLIYLMFREHWLFIGVYIVGTLIAALVAFILKLFLAPSYNSHALYNGIIVQRVAVIILIITGMTLLLVL